MGTVMQINANLKAIKSRLLGGGQAVWWEPDSWLDIIRNLEIQSLVCQLIREVAIDILFRTFVKSPRTLRTTWNSTITELFLF